ncbi:hypothetical protein SELMODRAFT_419480 [Selaginella moellendorffii]|uniref:Uncharacterized protein n=1 Tax=Selaginella moellendorffii TaxID=88036 RepID=D8S932_SELML|nr:hypothetical protein SELMODRAFT_419480 [Selaginella moellendorffii]
MRGIYCWRALGLFTADSVSFWSFKYPAKEYRSMTPIVLSGLKAVFGEHEFASLWCGSHTLQGTIEWVFTRHFCLAVSHERVRSSRLEGSEKSSHAAKYGNLVEEEAVPA